MSKAPDAFRTISEVAELLETPQHVLRFWETKFAQLKPVKRAGGRRYYRPGDLALLGGIKKLLHDDGMTIKGVQKMLREKGVRHVAGLAPAALQAGAEPPCPPARPQDAAQAEAEAGVAEPIAEADEQNDLFLDLPPPVHARPDPEPAAPDADAAAAARPEPAPKDAPAEQVEPRPADAPASGSDAPALQADAPVPAADAAQPPVDAPEPPADAAASAADASAQDDDADAAATARAEAPQDSPPDEAPSDAPDEEAAATEVTVADLTGIASALRARTAPPADLQGLAGLLLRVQATHARLVAARDGGAG